MNKQFSYCAKFKSWLTKPTCQMLQLLLSGISFSKKPHGKEGKLLCPLVKSPVEFCSNMIKNAAKHIPLNVPS